VDLAFYLYNNRNAVKLLRDAANSFPLLSVDLDYSRSIFSPADCRSRNAFDAQQISSVSFLGGQRRTEMARNKATLS